MRNRTYKITRTIALILTFTLLSTISLSNTLVSAAPGDETIVGNISLVPTIECIGVVSSFTGDSNQNNSSVLEYRQTGTSNWKIAPEMYADRGNRQHRGSIFWLAPNTQYEVRVTYTDPDGVTGGSVVGTVKTRNDNPPIGTNYYYVAMNGNDDTGDGSIGNPWQTIQKAANNVSAGDTVYVRAGTYNERVTISTSGTADNYITFRPYLSERVTIDGGNTRQYLFVLDGCDYIRVRGFTLTNNAIGDEACHVHLSGSDNCIIENNMMLSYRGKAAIWLGYGSSRNLFQNNDINTDTRGFFYWKAGEANVFRNNSIHPLTSSMWDGFGGGPENELGYMYDCDFYNNDVSGCDDDGIQPEGGGVNVRIWGNRFSNCYRQMALCPILLGPTYVFRNITDTGTALKLGDGSYGRIYLYHNTFYGGGWKRTDSGLGNIVAKNNIVGGGWYVYEFPSSPPDMDFDYNEMYTTHSVFAQWGSSYSTLASFQSGTGQEAHGQSNSDRKFTDAVSGNFSLQSDSPCIDAGVILPSFNDTNSPWPYSGGAPDIGAYEYGSGGPTNRPPVLSLIGNKSVNTEQQLQFTISATDPDGDLLNYSAYNLPQGATFNPQTRIFSWTPDSNQAGSYPNVRFTVSDGSLTDYENITITVLGGDNEPPVLNTIGNKSVNAGELLQFTISATDPDYDALTYSASNLPLGAAFNPQTRTFSWTPTSSQVDTYQNVHFEVSDGELSDSENITITVTTDGGSLTTLRVNAAGGVYNDTQENTWQADQAYSAGSWGFYGADNTVDRGTSHSISGTADDRIYQTERYGLSGYKFDLGNGAYDVVLHFAETYSGITGPGQRVFDVSIEGQLVLDNLDIYSEAGYSSALIKSFSNIVIQDGQLDIGFAGSIEQPEINGIEIFVTGGNHAPVLSPIGNKSIAQEDLLQFVIYATDADNDLLTFSADNLPLGANFNPETRIFSWTPNSSQVGSYPYVHFEVSDGSLTDFENITINVLSNDNSAPVLDTIGNKSVREGETLEFTISATDPDDDMLTFSANNLPLGADFDPETRIFSWTPALGQRGNYSYIRFKVTDGVLSDSEYIIITVTTNNPPVLYDIGDRSVREGKTLEFTIYATDPDDDPITYSAFYLPQGASFDPETRIFSWTPNSNQIGTYPDIFFKASDGTFSDAERITITVLSLGNNAPVLETIGDRTINETELLEFTISATDPDDDPLTFSAGNLPNGASFDPETKTFSWIPDLGQEGQYLNIHFETSDGSLTDSEEITITVYMPTLPAGGGGGDTGGDSDVAGGGGGSVGGDSVPSDNEPDMILPVIQEVETSDIGTDSVVIRWTTNKPSTSQVEYWASPSKFSPLHETLVTEHEIYLTDLTPGTDYHYRTLSQDEAGNLATSPEYDFTTPTKPAAFIISWLTISPAEVSIGQELTIGVLITNTGDVAGSYEIALSIDDAVEATESIVDLAGGASQEVTFTITRETAGVYTVNVNGTTGTLEVSDVEEPAAAIELFSITPNYESDTGVITFARADYRIYESYYSTLFSELDAELILKVGLGNEASEEVTLIASGQSEPNMSVGSLNYTPAEGWTSGTYTFQAELRTGNGVIETSPPVKLIITAEVAAGVVSWATLGEIIGGVLIIALLVVLLILHRNRDMLRAQSLE